MCAGAFRPRSIFPRNTSRWTGSPEDWIEPVVTDLPRVGILREDDRILHRSAVLLPYANVIFDLDRAAALATVHGYLDDIGIAYCGATGTGDTCGPTKVSRAGNWPRSGRCRGNVGCTLELSGGRGTASGGLVKPLLSIQYLRALAALAVVAFHSERATPLGQAGVDVFFVISGFIHVDGHDQADRAWRVPVASPDPHCAAVLDRDFDHGAHQHAEPLDIIRRCCSGPITTHMASCGRFWCRAGRSISRCSFTCCSRRPC